MKKRYHQHRHTLRRAARYTEQAAECYRSFGLLHKAAECMRQASALRSQFNFSL
jgi:hypothetical protein